MPNLTRLIPFAFCSVPLTLPTLPTNAHHSYAQFDQSVCETVEGIVRKWEFTYPHTWLWVTTKGPDNSDVLYGFEGADPSSVAILGWTPDILFKGDKVSVAYNPMRDGRNGGSMRRVKLPTGKTMAAVSDLFFLECGFPDPDEAKEPDDAQESDTRNESDAAD